MISLPIPVVGGKERSRTKLGRWRKTRSDKGEQRKNTARKVINLGCGDDSYGTHRVDIHPTKTTTHVFDVEKGIKFPDNYFDVVYEKNLLEHLRNVGYHLEEVFRVLKLGGKLILVTDYAGCKRYIWFKTHEGRYERKHKSNPYDKHFSFFTKSHLQNHLVSVGFDKIWISFIDTNKFPVRVLDRIMRVKPRIQVVAIK